MRLAARAARGGIAGAPEGEPRRRGGRPRLPPIGLLPPELVAIAATQRERPRSRALPYCCAPGERAEPRHGRGRTAPSARPTERAVIPGAEMGGCSGQSE